MSRHASGWTEVLSRAEQPLSPSSVTDSIHSTIETFDEYLANLPIGSSFSSPKLLGLEGFAERIQDGGETGADAASPPGLPDAEDGFLEQEPRYRLSHEGELREYPVAKLFRVCPSSLSCFLWHYSKNPTMPIRLQITLIVPLRQCQRCLPRVTFPSSASILTLPSLQFVLEMLY